MDSVDKAAFEMRENRERAEAILREDVKWIAEHMAEREHGPTPWMPPSAAAWHRVLGIVQRLCTIEIGRL